jgi:hypothetical protein
MMFVMIPLQPRFGAENQGELNMKRSMCLSLLLAAVMLVLASAAGASDGRGDDRDGHGNSGRAATYGPYTITTTDGGSCGQDWAADNIRRTYTVRPNGSGTFGLLESDIGSFTTIGPVSPGACQTNQPHGTVTAPGIQGGLAGFLAGTIACAGACVFNPAGAAACPPADCTRSVFVLAAFGPTATLATSAFRFDYYSPSPLLKYHHWTDEGTSTTESFFGDIATA